VSEPNLVNVWIYPYLPNEWHCQTFEGITGIGRTRDEAKATFDRDWNQRAPYNLIEGHPPRAKRSDEKPVTTPDKAIEVDAIPFTKLAHRFHPDVCGKRKFDAHAIMQIILELRDSARAKA
jgi:hypothetical protein